LTLPNTLWTGRPLLLTLVLSPQPPPQIHNLPIYPNPYQRPNVAACTHMQGTRETRLLYALSILVVVCGLCCGSVALCEAWWWSALEQKKSQRAQLSLSAMQGRWSERVWFFPTAKIAQGQTPTRPTTTLVLLSVFVRGKLSCVLAEVVWAKGFAAPLALCYVSHVWPLWHSLCAVYVTSRRAHTHSRTHTHSFSLQKSRRRRWNHQRG